MATKKKAGVGDAAAQRLNIRLSVEGVRRLGVHALMSGRKPGQIVDELIREHLREWALPATLSDRATRMVSAISDGPVESDGRAVA